MSRPLRITSPTPAQPLPTPSSSAPAQKTNRPPFRYHRTSDPLTVQPESWPLNEKSGENNAGAGRDDYRQHSQQQPSNSHSRSRSRALTPPQSNAGHSRHFPPPLSRPLIPSHHRYPRASRQSFSLATPGPASSCPSSCSFLPAKLRPWAPIIAWGATSLGFVAAITFWKSEVFTGLDDLSVWLREQGNQGYAILAFLIFLTTIPPLPLYSTLIVLAGYTYGAISAFVLSYIAALFGAFVVFQFSRCHLRAGTTTHAFPLSLRRIVRAIEKKPSLLFLIRLAPYPYNVMSYVLGAGSSISLSQYMACTAVSLLKLIVHTAIGSELHSFSDYHVKPGEDETQAPGSEDQETNPVGRYWTIFGIGLCIVLFIYLWLVARRAVDELDDPRENYVQVPISSVSPHPRRQEFAAFLANDTSYAYDVEANALFDGEMTESPFKPRGSMWIQEPQSSTSRSYLDEFDLALNERGPGLDKH